MKKPSLYNTWIDTFSIYIWHGICLAMARMDGIGSGNSNSSNDMLDTNK